MMGKNVSGAKQVIDNNLKHKPKSKEYEFAIMLVERVIETKEKFKKQNKTEKPQVSRIDVLVLIDELKKEFKKINEKSKEIAQMRGRTAVTYADAEEAIRLIKAEKMNKRSEKPIKSN